MDPLLATRSGRRRLPRAHTVLLVLGIALFATLVLRLDPSQIARGLRGAGWALAPACAFFVLNLVAATFAWRETIQPGERDSPIRFFPLFAALWSGHSVEGVGIAAGGEVTKGSILARRIPTEEAVAALLIYGFLNAAATVALAVCGPLVALFVFDLPRDVVAVLIGASAMFAVALVLGRRAMRGENVGAIVRIAERLRIARSGNSARLAAKIRLVSDRFTEFRTARPASFYRAVAWCSAAKVFQILEAWILIYACLPDKSPLWLLVVALVGRSATLLIGWVTAFVPGRIGVAEGGAAAVFELLGLGAGIGLAFALLRRLRRMVVIPVGFVISAGVALREKTA